MQPKTIAPAKKPTALLVLCGAVLAVLLLVVAGLVVRAKLTPRTTSRIVPIEALTQTEMQQVILKGDGVSQDNTALQYYFWSQYYYYLNSLDTESAAAFSLDAPYDEHSTWEDRFLEEALVTMQETVALCAAAENAGFTMPEDYAEALESTLGRFATYAEANGYLRDGEPDVDAYLQASYGPGASVDSFRTYLAQSYLATAYVDSLYESAPDDADARYELYRNTVREAVNALHFEILSEAIVIAHPEHAE